MIITINAVRNTTLAFVIGGAVLTGCGSNNNTKAKAVKVDVIELSAQVLEHNKKLEEKFLSYSLNQEDRENLQREIDGINRDYGIFSASIAAQKFIDAEQMKLMLNQLLEACRDSPVSAFYTESFARGFLEWLEGNYQPEQEELEDKFIYTETRPFAQKCLDGYDQVAEASEYLTSEDKEEFKKACAEFEKKQTNKNSTQALSDLIAFKVFTYDRLLYNRHFVVIKSCYHGLNHQYKDFDEFFDNLFVKKAQPTP